MKYKKQGKHNQRILEMKAQILIIPTNKGKLEQRQLALACRRVYDAWVRKQ